MAETVDELTVQYEEDGKVLVKEVDKAVLSKGAWCTVMYKYQDMNKASGEYGPEKVTIRRYKKMNGVYRAQSKFNISGEKQAKQVSETLTKWF